VTFLDDDDDGLVVVVGTEPAVAAANAAVAAVELDLYINRHSLSPSKSTSIHRHPSINQSINQSIKTDLHSAMCRKQIRGTMKSNRSKPPSRF